MKILVIGGSYFYGRVFVMLASKLHDITVVNRGTYSLEEFGVKQIKGDRHDVSVWQQCGEEYDAVVDFCAYEPGDVYTVLKNMSGTVRQYILISTVDVYERRMGASFVQENACKYVSDTGKAEDAPFETRQFPGEAGAYISGKVALEQELRQERDQEHTAYTVLRPAILYGPYNYAPRESLFIRMAVQNRALPRFTDADGHFQFLYVKDGAEAILKCIGNEKTYEQAYNLCGDEVLDYDRFFAELKAAAEEVEAADRAVSEDAEPVGAPLSVIPLTLSEAQARGIPIPFPATAAETELVSNRKSREELEMAYTPLAEGMRKTFRAFRHI